MIFVHENTKNMAWSLTAKVVVLREITQSSPVRFTVRMDEQTVATFDLLPVNGKITLPLQDLLEAILPRESGMYPLLSGNIARHSQTHEVHISARHVSDRPASAVSLSLTCFRGGINESKGNSKTSRWLSWKPQVSQTFRWGREPLSLLLMPDFPGEEVKATIYYRYHSPEIKTLAPAPEVINSKPTIWSYDCSYERIADLGTYSEEDDIIAYDVTMGALPIRRFILGPSDKRGREFIFQNSMGVLDTMFTNGEIAYENDLEVATVLIDKKEIEIKNNFTARQKTSTSLLQREREITNLYELLRSDERYILEPGDIAKRIVVDSVESDISFGQPSGAMITYHLATRFSGEHFDDKNLGEYEFTQAE